ncbi:bifunctional glutamate N-acetyltransferase/amino-acid acetyltransferase ArgJ [Maritalea mediterranea]|uniref:Arginine biosynthesis bifunctional protein ArgJ n=1 Tax=Maritalea mediterranea TaxID=2909667 RepID=A0ABS9EC93_9HYPH|nr:bifunctional glutamate N-acetyltransferase/amino-acid acetyltransferase ArgJ [Maritalea mediterranea]MCF4099494.1 bifunctional glutamate N-acetyltransferase/amino-acid acetyltransferase ArgJ [Maritalea mediterranea]
MELDISPLAPAQFAELNPVAGVDLFTAPIGNGYKGRNNLLLAKLCEGTKVAGVFTTSKCASAPIDWCKAHIANGTARGLLVNAGNANAFVGQVGAETVEQTAQAAAAFIGCTPQDIFVSSTGVIGEPLDPAPMMDAIGQLTEDHLGDYEAAANAIRTTDTYAKGAGAVLDLDGVEINISGIAKGSGMIAPNMATMLAYVFTDAPVSAEVLDQLLKPANQSSFNAITVDSDTSTSDCCLLFATGQADIEPITDINDPRCALLAEALNAVLHDLALQIVCDGEGAQKLITVKVEGAVSDESADVIARSIANSPLVKTAVAGEDANWGRVVMAVGKAGEPADRDKLQIRFGDLLLTEQGRRSPHYKEEEASAYMQNDQIEIGVDLGLGDGTATIYTCDLTHGYISINGDYRS